MARVSKYQEANTALCGSVEWRAGLYIRLSREDGDKPESESIRSQKAILERFVYENPSVALSNYYIDDGWSGTDFERPAFREMLADITGKKINCVIVKDLSRFGRNYVEAGKYLETVFPLFGIRFIAVNDMIDSVSNPQSINNVIVPFKNIINDEYCRDISLKVRSALDIRRRQGKFIGSFAAYGYKKDLTDHNRLVVDEESAETVKRIYKSFLDGNSISAIVRELNGCGIPNPSQYKAAKGLNCRKSAGKTSGLWLDSTVRRILTNELYIGNLVQKKSEVISHKIHRSRAVAADNRIVVENTHEPIISKADFQQVQSLLNRDTRISPQNGMLSKFAGFIKCADCGRAMVKRTIRQPYKTYEYYVCSTYKKTHSNACTKHAIRADVLDDIVLTVLNKYVQTAVDFDRLVEKINKADRGGKSSKLSSELSAKERELAKFRKILLDVYPDYKNGLLTLEDYFVLKKRYEESVEKTKTEIGRIKSEMQKFENGVDGANEFISSFKKYKGFTEITRDVVVELIDNVFIGEGGEVEISLKCKDAFVSAKNYVEEKSSVNGFLSSI